jgi:hypothetical protein
MNFFGIFLIAAGIIAIVATLITDKISASTTIILLAWPLALAAGLTYSARKFTLKVDGGRMDEMNDYIMEFLVSENLMTVSEDAGGIWMESTKPWNRWFNHWFNTEKVRIIRTPMFIKVIGHRRYVDGLDSKLRFGRKK